MSISIQELLCYNTYTALRKAQNNQGFLNAMKSQTVLANNVQSNTAVPKTYKVYAPTEDTLYTGGNATGLSFFIRYAGNSTDENPIMIAKGVDEHGDEFEQNIYINDINPNHATIVEMRALEAYLNVTKKDGFSSLPYSICSMGLNDKANFFDVFRQTIREQDTLRQYENAKYYLYSMQEYYDFFTGADRFKSM